MKKLFIIKRCFAFLLVLMLMMCTGCWNRKELKELGLVGAVSIDTEDDKVKLTYEVILPKKLEAKGTDDKSAIFLDSEGNSIFDAIRNVTLKFDKKLYWSHTNVIFLSEDCAKDGLQNYMDMFNREHDLRQYIHLLIVKDMPASEIMNNEWQEGTIPSRYIESISEDYIQTGKTTTTEILDFLKAYYTQGIEPVIGSIVVVDKPGNKSEDGSKEKSEDDKENKLPSLEGLYVFKDDKLLGYLDGVQTKGYNLLTNKMKSGVIVSKSPDNEGKSSLKIQNSSSDIKVKLEEGKFQGNVSLEVRGVISEESGKEDITKFEVIKTLEKLFSETLKLQIEDCIKQVQKYGSDVFGFGRALHIKNPDEWKKVKDNWNEIFSDMEINVEVKTVIEKAGVSNQQLRIKEKELNDKT